MTRQLYTRLQPTVAASLILVVSTTTPLPPCFMLCLWTTAVVSVAPCRLLLRIIPQACPLNAVAWTNSLHVNPQSNCNHTCTVRNKCLFGSQKEQHFTTSWTTRKLCLVRSMIAFQHGRLLTYTILFWEEVGVTVQNGRHLVHTDICWEE